MENFTRLAIPVGIDLCASHPYFFLGDLIWRIGMLLCVLLGMPGHLLVIVIMLNPKNRRQPVCLYFATIAVCEFIYLISMRVDLCRNRTRQMRHLCVLSNRQAQPFYVNQDNSIMNILIFENIHVESHVHAIMISHLHFKIHEFDRCLPLENIFGFRKNIHHICFAGIQYRHCHE
jgi:hypothetical protein